MRPSRISHSASLCTWFERRCWNSHFSHFWEIDQIWRGHKIGSFDPVITNLSATDARWPQLYVFSHSDATNPLRKACSERTSLSRPNEHVKTNERTKIYNTGTSCFIITLLPAYCWGTLRWYSYNCTGAAVTHLYEAVALMINILLIVTCLLYLWDAENHRR